MPAPHRKLGVEAAYEERDSYEGFGGYNKAALHAEVRESVTQRTKRTWDGVFLPVSLSIFGVVLFIRLPWIVGQCGLWLTLVGILICYTVTLLTTISLAAISTNGFTGDGGPYMMISRCLGPQIGTTVGITFVLANLVATAMYLVGGVDVVLHVVNTYTVYEWYSESTYGITVACSSLMLLALLIISFLKVEKVFRALCFLLTLVSVVDVAIFILRSSGDDTHATAVDTKSGFTGIHASTWQQNWDPQFTDGNNFQSVLSILFPGVSGLMSGVCLSGDLKNGAKAMPRGIAYAWVTSLVTYIAISILVASSIDRSSLQTNFGILRDASDSIVYSPGEFCSSFAAGLSMMVGSSRVLRAIARDELIPFRWVKWLADASTKRTLVFYWAGIQLVLFLGNSYAYASAFATQVFCANFLALNVSTFLSSATGMASFRPVYGFFNTTTALCGAVICVVVMVFISPLVSAAVLTFMFVLLIISDVYIDQSKVYWGDASQPLFFYVVRKWLLRLDERKEHIRHWRPSIMHLVTDPLCSLNLIHAANNLKKGGLYEICLVLEGSFHDTSHLCFKWKGWLMDFITASGVKAFGVVTFGKTLRSANQNLLRTCGLGGMRPNTVLISMDEILQRDYFLQIYDAFAGRAMSFGSRGATPFDFGTVRPLRDVNNARTEFWDLKRDEKGNVITTSVIAGQQNTDSDEEENPNRQHHHTHHHHRSHRGSASEPSHQFYPDANVAIDITDVDEGTHLLASSKGGSPSNNLSVASAEKSLAIACAAQPLPERQEPGDIDDLAATLRMGPGSLRTSRRVRIRESVSIAREESSASPPRRSSQSSPLVARKESKTSPTKFLTVNAERHHQHAETAKSALRKISPAAVVVETSPEHSAPKGTSIGRQILAEQGLLGSLKPKAWHRANDDRLLDLDTTYVALNSDSESESSCTHSRSRASSTMTDDTAPIQAPNSKSIARAELMRQQRDDEADVDKECKLPAVASVDTSSSKSQQEMALQAHLALHSSQPTHSTSTIHSIRKNAEDFKDWLKKSMRGEHHRSNSVPPDPSAASPIRSRLRSIFQGMSDNGPSAHHARCRSEPIPIPTGDNSAETAHYVHETVARAHTSIKKPFGWGLFRSGRGGADEAKEEALMEKVIAQRHVARLTGDVDLCHYSDIAEFCGIAKDVASMQMNLLIARNMDKLDMSKLNAQEKGDIYIDIWVPHESDAILFLMSYCFSMTSVWKKKAKMRLLSIVTLNDEMEEEQERLELLVREHRLPATVVVISLEAEMARREISDPDQIEELLETQEGRASVLNSLMRHEVERNDNKTAVIFVRVESYSGAEEGDEGEEDAEEWFANLVTLAHGLPPMLLLAAGSVKCRSNDW